MNSEPHRQDRALLRAPGEGELVKVAGVEHLFQLTAAHTDGFFSFEEFTLEPGIVGARPHIHRAHDEYFYVLDGELTFYTEDGEITVGPRYLLAARRGVPHGFRNAGADLVKGLCLYTPAGYEGYFRNVHAAVAAGAEVTDELLAEFRSQYSTESF